MKTIWESKTFWFNLLSGLSLFFALPEFVELVGPNGIRYVLLANGAINIVLRYFTTTELKVM